MMKFFEPHCHYDLKTLFNNLNREVRKHAALQFFRFFNYFLNFSGSHTHRIL
jgi:hypothetical protein